MDFRLSKDVPTMFQTILEQILGSDVVCSKKAKSIIFAIFDKKFIHLPRNIKFELNIAETF